MSKATKIFLLVLFASFLFACKKDENSSSDRLAKRQMHFTFVQYQKSMEDSLVTNATIKLYKNFVDFDADTAVVLQGKSVDGLLVLPGEDDGAAYYYRATHNDYGEETGSAINAHFDDYFRVEF